MGARGPEPEFKTTLSVIEPKTVERPKPFKNMSGAAKSVWIRIVSDLPADFYKAHELDLLREYCEQAARAARAGQELRKRDGEGEVMEVGTQYGKRLARNPWFDIAKESASVMSTLATKLRIAKNSKLSNRDAVSKMDNRTGRSSRKGLMFGD